jgi:hypothetical protein
MASNCLLEVRYSPSGGTGTGSNWNDVGNFTQVLPFGTQSGIECRSGGPTNDYQLVLTFGNPVSVNGSTASTIVSTRSFTTG